MANLDFHVTYDKHLCTCISIIKGGNKGDIDGSWVWIKCVRLFVWWPIHVHIYFKSGSFKCPEEMGHNFTKYMIFCNRMFPLHKAIRVFGMYLAKRSPKSARERHGIIHRCLALKKSYNVKIYTINLCNRFQCE